MVLLFHFITDVCSCLELFTCFSDIQMGDCCCCSINSQIDLNQVVLLLMGTTPKTITKIKVCFMLRFFITLTGEKKGRWLFQFLCFDDKFLRTLSLRFSRCSDFLNHVFTFSFGVDNDGVHLCIVEPIDGRTSHVQYTVFILQFRWQPFNLTLNLTR